MLLGLCAPGLAVDDAGEWCRVGHFNIVAPITRYKVSGQIIVRTANVDLAEKLSASIYGKRLPGSSAMYDVQIKYRHGIDTETDKEMLRKAIMLVEEIDRAMVSFCCGKNNMVAHVNKDYSLSNIDNLLRTMINDTINDACNRALIVTGIIEGKVDKVLGCNFNRFTIEPHGHHVLSSTGSKSDNGNSQSSYMYVYVVSDVIVGIRR